jgi:hypothetical protein
MIWAGLQALSLSSKIAICTTLAAALFSAGLYVGHKWGVSSCYEATIEAQRHTIETGIKQAVVSDQTVTKYVDRVQVVQGKSRTIIKEIPIYVQDTVNLSGGWRMLHNNAVYNELPDTTRDSDEGTVKAQSITATDALETVAANYGICHENSQTLQALQSWVREQSAIR